MQTPAGLLRKMESLSIESVVKDVVGSEDFLLDVTDANREQLEFGLNAKGEKIGEYGSREYAAMKREMNPNAKGGVDLMLTHALERSMFAKVEGDAIAIDSTDWKSEHLKERYGNEIYGLTEQSKEDLGFVATSKIAKKVKDELVL